MEHTIPLARLGNLASGISIGKCLYIFRSYHKCPIQKLNIPLTFALYMIYLKYIMLYYHNAFLSSVNAIRHGLSVSVLPNLRASRFLKKAKNGLRLKMKNKATYGNSQDYKMLHFSLIYFFRSEITPKEIAY